jgi:nucleoside-diphosphate-sugar epimerase
MKMKVLVTGANGFTGGRLAHRLKAAGHDVVALVRPSAKCDDLTAAGIELFQGQLTSRADVARAVEGCDKVFHVAAVFRTAGHPDSHYYDVNVGGTQHVLDAAQAAGCERVVYCSTGGVHGHVADPPANEDYRFSPGDVYQESKVAAEAIVRDAMKRGQRAVIFRPAAIYGEGDTRFLKLYRSIQNRHFVMLGSGHTRLHMVHVDDLCHGIELCGSEQNALGQVFLLAGPDAPTLTEIAALIANVLEVPPPRLRIPVWPVYAAAWMCERLCVPFGIDPPLHRRRVSFFTHHREFDISRARSLLGYAPQVTAAAGIARTAAWYIAQGLLKPPARNSGQAFSA